MDKSHNRKQHGMPCYHNAQYAHCLNEFVICSECDTPRVLYAARKLHFLDIEQLKSKLEMALYTCGSSLQDLSLDGSEDPVMSETFVQANLSCLDLVEMPYYSSASFLNVCIQCSTDDLATDEIDIYPRCVSCLAEKPKIYKRKRSCGVCKSGGKRQHVPTE